MLIAAFNIVHRQNNGYRTVRREVVWRYHSVCLQNEVCGTLMSKLCPDVATTFDWGKEIKSVGGQSKELSKRGKRHVINLDF